MGYVANLSATAGQYTYLDLFEFLQSSMAYFFFSSLSGRRNRATGATNSHLAETNWGPFKWNYWTTAVLAKKSKRTGKNLKRCTETIRRHGISQETIHYPSTKEVEDWRYGRVIKHWTNLENIYCNSFRAIFVRPWKIVSVSVRYLIYQPLDKEIKHGLFVFLPKKTIIWRRHCSISQSCCSMRSKRSIDWFLESPRAWSFFARAFA